MKLLRSVAASLGFLAILLCTYYVHIAFFKVNVVLYSAVLDAVIAVSIGAAMVFLLKPFSIFSAFERYQLLVIWLLVGYVFAISIPTVIDRSLSFYILEKLQQRGGGIRLDRFEDVFTREYVKEHHLVDVRLTEQEESGTIIIKDGCVMLTQRGANLASFSRFFRQHLLPKQRLLMGTYSDALTDPFRNSEPDRGYSCH